MIKVLVTETYTREYELEVLATDYDTISCAVDAFKLTDQTPPSWERTCVVDPETGDELTDW